MPHLADSAGLRMSEQGESDTTFTMNMPVRILFGAGRLNDLHARKMLGKKALVASYA
jgi:hypothetical protein